MILLFAHGWGFDRHFWAPLASLLPEWRHAIDDRGYFGARETPRIEGPCWAITHSFGTMRVLADPPPNLVGVIAINGFAAFADAPDRPGVPPRVIDRMLRRFEDDPRGVLTAFRASLGCDEPFGAIEPQPLRTDLLRLRNEAPPLPGVPLVAIHGALDPLLPATMRDTTLGPEARRIESATGGHLLPLTDPAFCARAIREVLGP